jgi:hypothetical protein
MIQFMRLIQKGLGKVWALGLWRLDTYWGHNETHFPRPVCQPIESSHNDFRHPQGRRIKLQPI